MLQLCGFSLSNYHNKVKFVLLEHDIPFEEVLVGLPLRDPDALAASPLGKVPFLRTEQGAVSESQAIVEYLAARYPDKAIFPAAPFEAAKAREITIFLEVYVEWVAREIYGAAFFNGKVSEEVRDSVAKRLPRALAAFKALARFDPYLRGSTFGVDDIAAFVHLPLVALATRTVYGRDFVEEAGIDWKTYLKHVGQRPAAERVTLDRKTVIESMKRA